MEYERICAKISLNAIADNFRNIQNVVKMPVLCVVKADAYGHGAVPVARCLEREGAAWFAVATVQEGIELRENGIQKPILLLGFCAEDEMDSLLAHHITAEVCDEETARLFSEHAVQKGMKAECHFALDTGMGRIGFDARNPEEAARRILEVARLPGLHPTGIFTHFAVADVADGAEYTDLQCARFGAVCDTLCTNGLDLKWKHCANSAGMLKYEQTRRFTMARAGIILYGYPPDVTFRTSVSFRPAMTVCARVAQVHPMQKGESVSYGRTYIFNRDCRVAVVTAGYADGYLRRGSGQAKVVIGGVVCPVRGRICMDMCMAELPDDLCVRRGDEVILFGDGAVTADDVAQAAETISYEVLCAVARRVPRIYAENQG